MKMDKLKLVQGQGVTRKVPLSTPPWRQAVSVACLHKGGQASLPVVQSCAVESSRLEAAFFKAGASRWASSVCKAVRSSSASSVVKVLLSSSASSVGQGSPLKLCKLR